MSKHTPGPWKIGGIRDGAIRIDSHLVGTAWVPMLLDLAESDANARLIAAAPEMFEAARHFMECETWDGPGEPCSYCGNPGDAFHDCPLTTFRALFKRIEGTESPEEE